VKRWNDNDHQLVVFLFYFCIFFHKTGKQGLNLRSDLGRSTPKRGTSGLGARTSVEQRTLLRRGHCVVTAKSHPLQARAISHDRNESETEHVFRPNHLHVLGQKRAMSESPFARCQDAKLCVLSHEQTRSEPRSAH
jgi:hypothetical protein